jgi:YfiH family protein
VPHGFGVRGFAAPPACLRPRQVHGAAVVSAAALRAARPAPEADGVVATEAGAMVGVVTADCVPILLAAADGAGVAAVHAGWRGLARGVVSAGVAALARASGTEPVRIAAAIGPHIGACCYEVDAPVLDAISAELGAPALASATPVRSDHWMLDLGALATFALVQAGVPEPAIGKTAARCTACDRERFHSHRRDGPGAGRLVHFVAVPGPSRRVRGEA